jgi:RNA polymerase sigma factor (sigma-70 family)
MIASCTGADDRELVEAVRSGDDSAFEELYRRYHPRIAAYVRRKVRDPARAEDLAQDAFFSALRRMRATDSDIAFKPWIFEIARNATIDHWRRSNRAEEVSVEAEELRQSDRVRLVGSAGPDSALVDKERLDHLRGAFDELSDVHTRILVMRELEGLSYREIAERLDLSRSSVESALFRARRRLESEYADISEGRRCTAMRTVMARMAEGMRDKRDESRLARHARRCHVCRRRARELGVEPLAPLSGLRRKAAALVPLPLLPRRGDGGHGGAATGGQSAGSLSGLLPAAGQVGAAVAERTAAIVAAAALAGAGGMALSGTDVLGGDPDPVRAPAIEHRAPAPDAKHDGARAPAPSAGDRSGGAAAGEAGAAGGRESHDGRAGDGAAGTHEGSHGAGGGDASGHGEAGGGPGAGDVGLPGLPQVPGEVGGGPPSAPSGDGPRLPEPPAPPTVKEPPAPDVPLATPRVESPPPVPVEAPAVPDLPPVDAAPQLESVVPDTAG